MPLALLIFIATAPEREAVVTTPTSVLAGPDAGAPVIGALMGSAPVTVTACVPTCDAPRGWAVLGAGGVVPLRVLAFPDGGRAPFEPPRYRWVVARDRDGGVLVRSRPKPDASVLVEEPGLKTLAVLGGDDDLLGRGWLERPIGGFVSTNDVTLLRDHSTMLGEREPALPLVFAFRRTSLRVADSPDGSVAVEKYARAPLLALTSDGGVHVDGGVLPGSGVRIAWPQAKPEGVPDGGAWLHVNLAEQTLTAWEGATPVFATLISAGSNQTDRRTRTGLHRVYVKALHDRMRGDEYFIEEVPFIQYFERGQGLHAAAWHNRYGQAVTHGCVNLSTADAEWLFEWSPPRLPTGWHTLWPGPAGAESLWVLIDRTPRTLADGGLRTW
ncbi:MAG: L,D-transpeptidase [Myxococcaceae bacterium]|nr:L,D-transpeptidase [Myxococcaceae bacterium]